MVDVVLGLQWGDEGKGKIADFLTPQYDIVARFQGGPNAGHSLEMNGKKHVLNTIPSGIFHKNCLNLIGNGVVIDPVRLKDEIERTIVAGADVHSQLLISRKSHLILPTHKLLDAASENAKGAEKIGSTLRGIGPTYKDKIGRGGLRSGDLFAADFEEKYRKAIALHMELIDYYGFDDFDMRQLEEEFFAAADYLRSFHFVDSEYFINQSITDGKKILAEGAQGSMLDIDFGSYPFVTSSNTISGGACTGLGISPRSINKVRGIFKAYCTRVGGGPFPTELENQEGQRLRDQGHEYGATTGRPRRCGWLDMVALKYAVMLSGVDEAIMMKSDVLSGFDTIRAGVAYKHEDEIIEHVPYDLCQADIEPVWKEFPGWQEDITSARQLSDLPQTFLNYLQWVEETLDVPVSVISVGPDREQTIRK